MGSGPQHFKKICKFAHSFSQASGSVEEFGCFSVKVNCEVWGQQRRGGLSEILLCLYQLV